ncbi:hypothetical protein JW949_00165 [Candidatus Woesearchaeota archaeon]|nr:hypothetical protein [Candidatus Woesearchaeota archaeon]
MMNWKKWSYVKKGAFIGAIIGILDSIIFPISTLLPGKGIIKSVLFVIGLPSFLIIFSFSSLGFLGCNIYNTSSCYLASIVGFILAVIVFALIGTLIGFIIEKIKK